MRKNIIKSIYLGIAVVVLALLVGAFFINRPREIHVSAYTKPYSVNSQIHIKDSVDIELLMDQADSFYSDKEQIVSSYIKGDEGQVKLNITGIYLESSNILVYDEKYYIFHYVFEIDFKTSDDYELFIKDAILELEYKNGVKSKLNIGSFSYYKYSESSEDLMISNLRVINKYKNDTNFYGFQIGLRNLSTYDIEVHNIKLLDINAKIGEILELDAMNESKEIEDYFNNYESIEENNNIKLNINSKENKCYTIALSNMDEYNLMYPLERAGILIEYTINGEYKTFVFENFLFYEQSFVDLSKYKFDIYTYDNN